MVFGSEDLVEGGAEDAGGEGGRDELGAEVALAEVFLVHAARTKPRCALPLVADGCLLRPIVLPGN